MRTYFDHAPVLPSATEVREDDDFDYIPWWTSEAITAVLGAIDADTWQLMLDMVITPTRVPTRQVRAKAAMITALMEALWLRSPIRPATTRDRLLPDRFTGLATTDPADWEGLGSLAAAWCLARLIAFATHTSMELDPQIAAAGPLCWQRLVHDDGAYIYTTALAQKYDGDRSFTDREFIEAINALAGIQLRGKDVIEFGAGTGAVSRLVASFTASLTAIEPAIGMRALLSHRTRDFDQVQVRAADCMCVDMPDRVADVVIEHAAVGFADEPIIAIIEAARLLRPGGTLVRIIPSIEPSEQLTAFISEFHAQLRRLGHGRGRIASHANNPRITAWLADRQIRTRVDTIATWTSHQPLHRHAAPFLNGSLPYLSSVPASDRQHAIGATLSVTGLDMATPIRSARSISTATSTLGGAHLVLPPVAETRA